MLEAGRSPLNEDELCDVPSTRPAWNVVISMERRDQSFTKGKCRSNIVQTELKETTAEDETVSDKTPENIRRQTELWWMLQMPQ